MDCDTECFYCDKFWNDEPCKIKVLEEEPVSPIKIKTENGIKVIDVDSACTIVIPEYTRFSVIVDGKIYM
jgi:hypothetical protein